MATFAKLLQAGTDPHLSNDKFNSFTHSFYNQKDKYLLAMNALCTIITKSHLHYAKALHRSIMDFIPSIEMHVLVVDMNADTGIDNSRNLHLYDNDTIRKSELGERIYSKYFNENKDHYRWSCKSVFMIELLSTDIEKVLYLDSDLFFYNDPSFLFAELDRWHVLLSPHFRGSDPQLNYKEYGRNNTHGLYNGGFVGANKAGIPALNWWGETCWKVLEKNIKKGYYDDQAHLNLLPILFDNIGSIKHRGCNIANWNIQSLPRVEKGGVLLIDGNHELIFIHFTGDTIRGILEGEDPLLKPQLEKYAKYLKEANSSFDLMERYRRSGTQKLLSKMGIS